MAKQNINVGTAANDKKGDSLRAAFQKVNANFTELYTSLGLINDVTLNLGAFEFAGSVMSTTDSTAIVIDQATTVTSNLSVGGNILPQTANGGDLGSSTLPWRSLYVSNNTIYIGGTAVGLDANGALTTGGTVVGSTPAWANITGKPTFATVATTGAYADLTGKPTLFSGSYNDLTNKPNLAGTYQFSVAADDSTQRVISTDEVIKFIGAGGITTASDAEGNITITGSGGSVSSLVNGAYTVSLGSDGALTFPGDIKSNGNINIDINLSDSTLRRWQFGEDGILTLPSVGKISNGAYDWTFGTDGKLTAPGNLQVNGGKIILNTGGNAYVESVDYGVNSANSAVNIFGGPYQKIKLRAGFGTEATWTFDTTGTLTFPNGTLKITDSVISNLNVVGSLSTGSQIQVGNGITSSTGIIISNGTTDDLISSRSLINVNGNNASMMLQVANSLGGGGPTLTGQQLVEVGSSNVVIGLRVIESGAGAPVTTFSGWTFNGQAGTLTFPDNTVQTTAWTGFSVAADDSTQRLINAGEVVKFVGAGGVTTASDAEGNITINYVQGDIRSEGAINIDINLSDSTLRRWRFGEDGDLVFPDATTQTTAFAGNAATVDITNTNGIDTNYSITFVENRDGAEILRADVDLTFNSATNLLTAGNVTTGILKINDGVHEQFQAKVDATGVVTHDCSSGHIFRHTSPDANWTANFTNLNLDSTYATSVTLIIAQGATGYYPSAVQIGGAAQTINWQGNVNPTVSTNRTDVVTFSIINNAGTYTVLGQLTGF